MKGYNILWIMLNNVDNLICHLVTLLLLFTQRQPELMNFNLFYINFCLAWTQDLLSLKEVLPYKKPQPWKIHKYDNDTAVMIIRLKYHIITCEIYVCFGHI